MTMTPKEYEESGVLLVDKEPDWTSHDVVNCVRRRFRVRKVGHCGTLDPIATGLLILVLGRATKLSSQLMTQDKVYEGTMCLGVETHTQDRAGEVTATADPSGVAEAMVREVAAGFVGEQMQIPPMVSAIKKGGKALYKLARKGKEVERDPRPITIHSLDITRVAIPEVDLNVACSKGTYVRTLCADIGRTLGCGAHLQQLRRTRSGMFSVDDAFSTTEIKEWEREDLLQHIIPLGELLVHLMDR